MPPSVPQIIITALRSKSLSSLKSLPRACATVHQFSSTAKSPFLESPRNSHCCTSLISHQLLRSPAGLPPRAPSSSPQPLQAWWAWMLSGGCRPATQSLLLQIQAAAVRSYRNSCRQYCARRAIPCRRPRRRPACAREWRSARGPKRRTMWCARWSASTDRSSGVRLPPKYRGARASSAASAG